MNDSWENQLIIRLDLSNPPSAKYIWAPKGNMWLGYIHNRLNGPAAIFYDGSKKWFKDNKLHNLNGPAVLTADGFKTWRITGELVKTFRYE